MAQSDQQFARYFNDDRELFKSREIFSVDYFLLFKKSMVLITHLKCASCDMLKKKEDKRNKIKNK